MKQIFTVFAYTFKDAIRKKAFIISTIIILFLIAVICAVPQAINILNPTEDDVKDVISVNVVRDTCYYIDDNHLIPSAEATLTSSFTDTAFLIGSEDRKSVV